MNLTNLSNVISTEYLEALKYYNRDFLGEDVPFLQKLNGTINIISPAQGIFTPKDYDYVLAIKQTLGGRYPDLDVVFNDDSSWIYLYHEQEGGRNKKANRDMEKNITDKIPVGVMIQTQGKGRGGARYKVAVGLPIGWYQNYFIIIGANNNGVIPEYLLKMSLKEIYIRVIEMNQASDARQGEQEEYNPDSIEDGRVKTLASVYVRQGQAGFRKKILKAYNNTCPITNCSVIQVLEAAHITPYMGPDTNETSNGIALRADIHSLWDLGLICIDPGTLKVKIDSKLVGSDYEKYDGKKIVIPENINERPSSLSLKAHMEFCNME